VTSPWKDQASHPGGRPLFFVTVAVPVSQRHCHLLQSCPNPTVVENDSQSGVVRMWWSMAAAWVVVDTGWLESVEGRRRSLALIMQRAGITNSHTHALRSRTAQQRTLTFVHCLAQTGTK